MRTWKNIKKIDKYSLYEFKSIKDKKINKFIDHWIDIWYCESEKLYSVSFYWFPIMRTWKDRYSVYRFIYKIAVEYMSYNKSYINEFLKSNDYDI